MALQRPTVRGIALSTRSVARHQPQWDENGRLLGSFTMNHGMGTQRYWHQNGRLRLEINSLNGKFFGRTRAWLRDGTLVQEPTILAMWM